MGSNDPAIGQQSAYFALVFMLGYLAAAQEREAEIARLRESAKAARQQTVHLMALVRGSHDKS